MTLQISQDVASDSGSRIADRVVQHFTDLDTWKVAHELTLEIYKWTKEFPDDERFGLVSQMRRSAVSIESNIAEGFGRLHLKEKQHFYYISRGSCFELETQILISRDTDKLSKDKSITGQNLCERIRKLLNGMIRSIKNAQSVIRNSQSDSH